MIRSLYTAVSGMITQEAKQDVISSNLANINTVGFKGDEIAVKKFEDVLIANYSKRVGGKNVRQNLGHHSLGSKIDEVATNFSQGVIEKTDKETDFALEGRGFFAVRTSDGIDNNEYYTRDGHFHVNLQGYLVTDTGNYVMDTNNQRIMIGRNKITCDNNGNISILNDNKRVVGRFKLKLVDFQGNGNQNDYRGLKKVGDNLYRLPENQEVPIRVVENNNITVIQSSLEKSNINAINEMVNMITTMRSFETNQKIVQSIDETLSKSANEVGSVR
ncbi:flagellar basal-body rod protein FlgG [Clostridium acetireducens DSM 10703]|jgi:flagellar basal-body rod protein FlgF|uniref:Flagellar basal-body rod protein FlgG n=1 Tax=Clostridium acetireducens DSM 10703 TaxID=1121290 RepID=A0A1E8EVP4_9CLOT|nr:flagellar hook-basal body complex protein [Clostridium acetireducens]OFH98051.1 flagellar basal-body rod protein FlgG [Clostridium acetireducens DSM 10703]